MAIDETVLTKGLMRKLNALLSAATSLKRSSQSGALRRRWSDAEKRRIVAESYQPGVSVSVVARRNDVNANLVFNWRRRFREQAGGAGGLVPVVVEPPPLGAAAGDAPAAGSGRIGRDLRLALPHRKCAATKLSPKYPAVFGGCLPMSFTPAHQMVPSSRAPDRAV